MHFFLYRWKWGTDFVFQEKFLKIKKKKTKSIVNIFFLIYKSFMSKGRITLFPFLNNGSFRPTPVILLWFNCDFIPALTAELQKKGRGFKTKQALKRQAAWDQTLAPYYLTEREGCCNPNFRSVNTEKKETDTENNFCDVKQNINN